MRLGKKREPSREILEIEFQRAAGFRDKETE
jgi:hypothetical protein